MQTQILDQFGRPFALQRKQSIEARYDNAQWTEENQRSWWMADLLSAKTANSVQVRQQLRRRSRYEVANNPYLFGVVNSNADDLINTGPTLKVKTEYPEVNKAIERVWAEWAQEVGLKEKLRTIKLSKLVDGEGFLVLKTVEDLYSSIKLYPVDIEADQVTTYTPTNLSELFVDGLTLHPVTGKPIAYHILKHNPGDLYFPDVNQLYAAERIPARHVIHWFNKFRAGQVRGIPAFTASLDLFTELRAFRKAVLMNAQIAANYTAILESDAPAGMDPADNDVQYMPFKTVPIDRGQMTMLPARMKMNQLDPKQPATSYEMFQEKCLGEACRPIAYPLNLALGTSQKFNFSSAKLDHKNYRGALAIERTDCDDVVLFRLLAAVLEEAFRIPKLIPSVPGINSINDVPHEWHWPGFEPLDDLVDADADHSRLSNGTLTWREFWAKRGESWEDVMAQQATERKEIERLGLVFGDPVKQTVRDSDEPESSGQEGDESRKRGRLKNRVRKYLRAFDESKHPRKDDGKFGDGSGDGKKTDGDKSDKTKAPKDAPKADFSKVSDDIPEADRKKAKGFFSRTWDTVHAVAADLMLRLGDAAPDILDTAEDYSKVFFHKDNAVAEHLGVGANTVCVIASHVLGRASVWIAKKLKAEDGKDTLTDREKAEEIAKLLKAIYEASGAKEDAPTADDILDELASVEDDE